MRYRKTENTLSLLGGALVGAAAMYLLDPQTGRRRRAAIAETAEDAWGNAGDMLHSGWDKVADRARDWGRSAVDTAQDYGQRMADRVDDLRSRGSDAASDYTDAVNDAGQSAADYGRRLWKRALDFGGNLAPASLLKGLRRRGEDLGGRARSAAADAGLVETQTPILPITLTGVGCCAAGVGLMYFLDPQRGRARRSWAQDKVSSLVRQTGRSFYRTGQDLANRVQGVAAQTRGTFSSAPVDSEQLVQRVRSEMGRVVSHPRLVQVMADGNGCITLTGSVLASEADRLRSAVESVPGVNLVVNRLEVHDTVEGLQRAASQQSQAVPLM